MPHYLHVQDFVDAYIGPFDTPEAAQEHYRFTKERGDGAVMIAILPELPDLNDPETAGMVITPKEDLAYNEELSYAKAIGHK